MRNTRDRIFQSILFELIALTITIPVGAMLFGVPLGDFGLVAAVCTTFAMLWTYAFNLGFDHAMLWLTGSTQKSLRVRIGHAILFEVGLVSLLVPFIAWYLGVTIWEALVLDVALAGFYLVYAFVFYWVYDIIWPAPETGASPAR